MDYIEDYKKLRLPLVESEELQGLLSEFGITHFIYTVHFLEKRLVSGASRKQSKSFSYFDTTSNQALKMYYISSGNEVFTSLIADIIRNCFSKNPEFLCSALGDLYFPIEKDKPARFVKAVQRFKDRDINSAVYYQFPDPDNHCMGVFVLYSDSSSSGLYEQLASQKEKLMLLLNKYHSLFYSAYSLKLNPWRNLNVISPVCCKVLQLLSEGLTTAQVAERLFLSRRGVDYHLDNAKVLLNASNRSHLIAKAVAYGIVDRSKL